MTMKNTKLLELREKMRAKRPAFIRQDAHRFKKLERKWVRPAGLHSKIRQKIAGHGLLVAPGYRGPGDVRGLLRDGKKPVQVYSVKDVEKMDGISQCAIIGKSVGARKRLDIVAVAEKKKISIFNIKDFAAYRSRIAKGLKERQSLRGSVLKKRVETKKEEKKKEGKSTLEDKAEDETKKDKEADRLEAEKVMITPQ